MRRSGDGENAILRIPVTLFDFLQTKYSNAFITSELVASRLWGQQPYTQLAKAAAAGEAHARDVLHATIKATRRVFKDFTLDHATHTIVGVADSEPL